MDHSKCTLNLGLQKVRSSADEVPDPKQKFVLATIFNNFKLYQVYMSETMLFLLSVWSKPKRMYFSLKSLTIKTGHGNSD